MAPKDQVAVEANGIMDIETTSSSRAMSEDLPSNTASAKAQDTIIFFDWDDTLLASSFVAKHGLRPRYSNQSTEIPPDIKSELEQLETLVLQLLHKALKLGEVIIITAAEKGWVELSCALFFPRVVELIQSSIRVISARTCFESYFPSSPRMWKVLAFRQEVQRHFGEYYDEYSVNKENIEFRHLISVGDSTSEREAAMSISENEVGIYGKTLKFLTHPSCEELRQQVEVVIGCLDHVCGHEGALDLQLSKQDFNRDTTTPVEASI